MVAQQHYCRRGMTNRVATQQVIRRVTAGATFLLTMAIGPTTWAQDKSPPVDHNRPFEITDNSFFVEEAFNQDVGVVQNIANFYRTRGGAWVATFTQEWPLFSHTHQISYTLPFASTDLGSGMGDAYIHYRLQVLDGGDGRPAFSPRVSLILPSGRVSKGLGQGNPGWEVNLPFSQQIGDLYVHWNAGFTQVPAAIGDDGEHDLFTPRVAGSGIWRARPMLNLMLEAVVEWTDVPTGPSSSRHVSRTTIAPGLRTGRNAGESQTVIGVALPISIVEDARDVGVFVYFSYETRFTSR
jgi:hypothetical protein